MGLIFSGKNFVKIEVLNYPSQVSTQKAFNEGFNEILYVLFLKFCQFPWRKNIF